MNSKVVYLKDRRKGLDELHMISPLDEEMPSLATAHGFVSSDWPGLRFEPWLVHSGFQSVEIFGNLGLIGFDAKATYFARVGGVLLVEPVVVAFRVCPDFVCGEPWRFRLTVYYIGDADDPGCPTFVAAEEGCGALDFTIFPGLDGHEVELSSGLALRFLSRDLSDPILSLVELFQLEADRLSAGRSFESFM